MNSEQSNLCIKYINGIQKCVKINEVKSIKTVEQGNRLRT